MRLIDADAIDRNTFIKAVGENGGFISFGDCLDMLKNQPTAYDIDKVVEQVGFRMAKDNVHHLTIGTIQNLVRKGGVNE